MWLKRSRTVTRRATQLLSVLSGFSLLVACGPGNPPAEEAEGSSWSRPGGDYFTVMSFNVDQYGYADRTGDGQANDPKPDASRNAVLTIIAEADPDILALQEMGHEEVFQEFKEALAVKGLRYPFAELLMQEGSDAHLAVLSRYPITSVYERLDDLYTMGDAQLPVKRGFLELDIAISPSYSFRLINAQLKSKSYHPFGQTEMRRNEARLLNNHVRRALSRDRRLNLLVVGDLNDHIGSAPLRTLMGSRQQYLSDLRPADEYGESWTFFDADGDSYVRYDYLLASAHMRPEFISEGSRVVRHPLNKEASARRPLLAVFRARDIDPESTPLLPAHELEDD